MSAKPRARAKAQPEFLLGAHMSIEGGTPLALERARRVGATALQIFVKNNNRWVGKTITDEEAREFRESGQISRLRSMVAHNSYLINLASPDPVLWRRSIEAMLDELDRCRRLGLSHLVTHPGAHVGEGEEWGVRRVAAALDQVRESSPDNSVHVALEVTAGQGTNLGYRFSHLRDIIGDCRYPEWVDVCLDTCHVFAAGYDFRDRQGYDAMMGEFDAMMGLDKLRVIHVNDSKRELGSRVDRHDHIGKGRIGLAGFGWIMRDPRLSHIPKILETPKGKDLKEDRRNLRILRKLGRAAEIDGRRPHQPA